MPAREGQTRERAKLGGMSESCERSELRNGKNSDPYNLDLPVSSTPPPPLTRMRLRNQEQQHEHSFVSLYSNKCFAFQMRQRETKKRKKKPGNHISVSPPSATATRRLLLLGPRPCQRLPPPQRRQSRVVGRRELPNCE